MKLNKWTLGLAAVGVVSLASAARADETMSQVQTALSNTTISGYVDTSIQWNPGTGNAQVAPVAFQNPSKADGFNLNVVDLALDKPMGEDSWAAGYHAELWMGPDANTLATVSNPFVNPNAGGTGYPPALNDYNYTTGASDFAIRQAYVSLRTPIANSAIDWKLGVFDSPLGYESTSSPANAFYTHSYGYTIEPTELTGLMGTYKINDLISVSAGIADTVDAMINERAFIEYDNSYDANYYPRAESMKTYFGAVTLTAPDSWGWAKGSTLTAGVINGTTAARYGATQTSWYAGATLATPVTGLKAGAAFDYLNLDNSYGESDQFALYAWTAALYANYQYNDKLSFAGRLDHLQSTDNMALDSLTADVQYNLWANVISRLEARWDHTEHGQAFGGTWYYYSSSGEYGSSTYTDPNKENAFMVALQVIYQF